MGSRGTVKVLWISDDRVIATARDVVSLANMDVRESLQKSARRTSSMDFSVFFPMIVHAFERRGFRVVPGPETHFCDEFRVIRVDGCGISFLVFTNVEGRSSVDCLALELVRGIYGMLGGSYARQQIVFNTFGLADACQYRTIEGLCLMDYRIIVEWLGNVAQ